MLEEIKRTADAALIECRYALEVVRLDVDRFMKDVTSLFRFETPCELESGDVGEHEA